MYMALMPKIEYENAEAAVREVYDDIRATRKSDYINDIWKVLANDPALLKRNWEQAKTVMVNGAIDSLTKEFIYLAVSITNNCEYCINSHTAAARSKGMTDAQFGELLSVVGLANQMNRLAVGTQVAVDAKLRQLQHK
jgi:AhpD family alkylhydroperoxidase